jgi:hypothetical protein
MSVPSNPTISQIVTEALKRGGRPNPSATEISDTTTHQLREVKADIVQFAPRHRLLKTHASSITTIGKTRYALPDDVDEMESVVLLDGPDSWTGTAQDGATTSITLAADFSEDSNTIIGKYIILTGGTGANQYRQATGYDNSTKVLTPDSNWTTAPSTDTTYKLINDHRVLYDQDKHTDWDHIRTPCAQGIPTKMAIVADEMWTDYAPDKVYGLIATYWIDLDRLDETGTVFTKLLREWRSIWIQGVATYVMQRFDDERFSQNYQVYQNMLTALAGGSSVVGQVQYRDL